MTGLKKVLDPTRMGDAAQKLEEGLRQRVVGQDDAIRQIVRVYQTFEAGLATPGRPVGSLLFLGPTGSGKTTTLYAALREVAQLWRVRIRLGLG